jgi:hypothetical protein
MIDVEELVAALAPRRGSLAHLSVPAELELLASVPLRNCLRLALPKAQRGPPATSIVVSSQVVPRAQLASLFQRAHISGRMHAENAHARGR